MSSYTNMHSINKETVGGIDGRSLLPLSQTSRKPKSKSARMKSTFKAIIHPVRTRREKKARKTERKQREETERVANIDDFLACGQIYYERQLQEKSVYNPFSNPRYQTA